MSQWTGFYSVSYRLLLKATRNEMSWDEAWAQACDYHEANPKGEGHWEFLAVAYLHLIEDGRPLDDEVVKRLAIISTKFQASPTTFNWKLMALIISTAVRREKLSISSLRSVGFKQLRDGHILDHHADISSQYHAYILLLIMRFGDPADPELVKIVQAGYKWLLWTYEAHGDPSALGRGRFQVFGYASMAAVGVIATHWKIVPPKSWLKSVAEKTHPEEPDGAISLSWSGPHRNRLLYGYNSVDDYRAFKELWTHDFDFAIQDPSVESSDRLWWHSLGNGSGLLSNRGGLIASVLNEQSTERSGKKAALIDLIAQFNRKRAEGSAPLIVRSGHKIPTTDMWLEERKGSISIRVENPAEISRLISGPLTIWVPPNIELCQCETTGSFEYRSVIWQATELSKPWHGFSLRGCRSGDIRVLWRTA